VYAIILERGRGLGILFIDEMQNVAIWGHFRVSYNIESSTLLMTLIEKNFLKCPISTLRVLADTNTSIALYTSTSKSRCICTNPWEDSLSFFMVDLT
jgi:hypothetical protein